jgi:trans-2,3-dihydro-3-hydroxyanthranilate isomerase
MLSLIRQASAMTTKRRYAILDVFTGTALAGNPLAIVLDSADLYTERMQAITNEFNLSETVFLSPPTNEKHRAAMRIFTPGYELPFAGHPTIGTAVYLSLQSAPDTASSFILEAPVGSIRCDTKVGTQSGQSRFELPSLPKPVALGCTISELAAALMLADDDIVTSTYQPCAFGAGNAGFAFIPVRNLNVLAKAQLAAQRWQALSGQLIGAYIYTHETREPGLHFRARMLDIVTTEDPATGSAVAAFAGVLAKYDSLLDGIYDFRIGQGFEMGRPSLIDLSVTIASGAVSHASISGQAVVVAEGHLYV